jgi:hypothetical protein
MRLAAIAPNVSLAFNLTKPLSVASVRQTAEYRVDAMG